MIEIMYEQVKRLNDLVNYQEDTMRTIVFNYAKVFRDPEAALMAIHKARRARTSDIYWLQEEKIKEEEKRENDS